MKNRENPDEIVRNEAGVGSVTVEYLGRPYAKVKCVDGIWYFPDLQGKYQRFVFQDRVRPVRADSS
jgi:hypothetical protein